MAIKPHRCASHNLVSHLWLEVCDSMSLAAAADHLDVNEASVQIQILFWLLSNGIVKLFAFTWLWCITEGIHFLIKRCLFATLKSVNSSSYVSSKISSASYQVFNLWLDQTKFSPYRHRVPDTQIYLESSIFVLVIE